MCITIIIIISPDKSSGHVVISIPVQLYQCNVVKDRSGHSWINLLLHNCEDRQTEVPLSHHTVSLTEHLVKIYNMRESEAKYIRILCPPNLLDRYSGMVYVCRQFKGLEI